MSLETIVSKMIAANEPESNIAKVIKYHKKDSSKINCKKCNHSWKVADGGSDLYMCHECGYDNNKSPLKAIECPEGFIDNEDGLGCVKIENIKDNTTEIVSTNPKEQKENIEVSGEVEENIDFTTPESRKDFNYGEQQKYLRNGSIPDRYKTKKIDKVSKPEVSKIRQKINENLNETNFKPGEKGAKDYYSKASEIMSKDPSLKKFQEEFKEDSDVKANIDEYSKELSKKLGYKESVDSIYEKVQKDNKDLIDLQKKAIFKGDLNFMPDGAIFKNALADPREFDKRIEEGNKKLNEFIQSLAEDELKNNPIAEKYSSQLNDFNNELFNSKMADNKEYQAIVSEYKKEIDGNYNFLTAENRNLAKKAATSALSDLSGIPEWAVPQASALAEFVVGGAAGLVDTAENYGYAPIVAMLKNLDINALTGGTMSPQTALDMKKISEENNIPMESVYRFAEELGSLKTSYTDENGEELLPTDLIEKGEYAKAANLAVNQAVGSAPSLFLSIAFPLLGGTILGASTAGQGFAKDMLDPKRSKQAYADIFGANLMKGAFETGTEIAGGKLFKLINRIPGGKGAKKKIVNEFINKYTNLVVKTSQGMVGEGLTEGLTNVGQELADVAYYGDEKTFDGVFKRSINNALVGSLMGGGATMVTTGSQTLGPEQKNLTYQHLAPKQWTIENVKLNQQIFDAKNDLETANSPIAKKRAKNKIEVLELQKENKIKKLNEGFDRLTEKDLIKYGQNLDEIEASNVKIGNENYTKEQQDLAIEEQTQAALSNQKLVTPEIYNADVEQIISRNLKASEKISKLAKGALKGINKEDLDIIYVGNNEAQEKYNMGNKDAQFTSEKGKATIIINEDISALTENTSSLGHELLHYMISKNFKTDSNGVKPLVDSFKNYLKEASPEIYDRVEQRIQDNYTDENGKIEKGADEEYLTVFSDLVSKEKIETKDGKPNLIKKLSNGVKSYLQGLGFGSVQLNDGKAVFDFIKNYSKNINNKSKFKNLDIKLTSDIDGVESNVNLEESIDKNSISNLNNLFEKYGDKKTLVEQSLLKTPQGQETFDFTKSEFGQSIGGLVETISKRLYDPVLPDLKRATSRDQFKQDLVSEAATIINNEFDPTKQEIGKFITNRLNLRANRIASKTFEQKVTDDVAEAKAVSTDEAAPDEVLTRKPIAEALNLEKLDKKSEKLVEGFLNNITISDVVKNKLKDPKLSNKRKINILRKSLGNLFSKQLKNEITKELGKNTKTSNDLSKYLDKNYDSLVNAALNNIDFQMGSGISSSWSFDNMPTKQEFIDYYEGKDILPSQPRSVKSDRKKSLVNAVAKQISNEALIDFAKKDPATAQLFNKENNISFASRSALKSPKIGLQTLANIPGFKDGSGMPALNVWKELGATTNIGFNLSEKTGRAKAIKSMEFAITEGNVPIDAFSTGEIMINSSTRFFPVQDRAYQKAKDQYNLTKLPVDKTKMIAADKARMKVKNDFTADMNKMISRVKKAGNLTYLVGSAKNWTKSKYSFGKIGNTIAKIKESDKNGTILKNNKANLAMFEQTMVPLYDLVYNDPSMVDLVMMLTNTSNGGSNLWFRQGAEVVGYSDFLLPSKKGTRGIEWEHAMQANNARLFLLNSAINKVPWGIVYPAVKRNYKVIALDKSLDGVLKAANRSNSMGENWNVYTDSWLSRYFSPEVLLKGGIDPKTIIGLNGESLAKMYNIDEAGQPVVEPITALKPIKKARIFDFDDTLAKTKSNVLYSLPDGTNGVLDATQFAEQFKKLQDAGAEFDYSEFSKVVNGSKGPLADVAKKINDSKGNRDVFVLTARPADANIAIQEFLKETLNINIPLENITGLADGKPSAKADWISGKVSEGYNDIFFADDVVANVKAVSDALNKLGVIKKVQVAKDNKISFSSKSLNRTFYEDSEGISQIQSPLSQEFNKMLENTKGIKAEARYSDARAAKMGGKTGFQAFVPYSAEDFLGLVYPTLGKGEQGNKDLKWWKDNVMSPYNDGMTLFESSKQASMLEWQQIKDQIKNTPTNLGKEAVRDFSNEDAIRVYLWNQQDAAPSDLSKKDIKALVDYVKNNAELRDFANQINSLNVNGYPEPTKGWLAGTITTDLVNHVNTTTRSEMLAPWQQAVDEIYTDYNKNKLKATYGEKYIEALDDVLYRMKTGRNRPSGANRITNNWLNWVNDSVGTIMFFNQRSAILQTISSINFINWSDNNPGAAAKAFANQKQYWSDFSYLFNSDFLKQRRSGLKTDVNADEIAQQAAGSTNKVRAGLSWLLKKGFLPTQIADSFAIASGGSTFYRNRVGSLVKSGMSKVDAEKQAFADFRDSANESQQSSDPSRVSMEQASSLGRVILAFANTPIQYTRLTKRATQDLIAGRGDWKTNVSKIVYYGAVQNIIFTTLQQAMFGMLFADDDDEFQNKKKDTAVFNVANSTVDTFLRGSGVAGAFVAMLKNMALEIKRQKDSKRSDYTKVADKLFSVSPPIDSKFRKLKSAGRAFTYKQELEKMKNKGLALDNPAFMAIAQVISAFGNIPADRVLRKLNNIVEATNNKNAIWQRMALIMGWGQWELGITGRKTEEAKEERDSFKNLDKAIKKATKRRDKEEKKKTPIKALEAGVLGEANRDGSIVVAKGLSKEKRKEVVRHEKVHQKEISSGKLDYDDKFVYYGKKKYERKNGSIMHNGKAKIEGDHSLPWEKVAHKH